MYTKLQLHASLVLRSFLTAFSQQPPPSKSVDSALCYHASFLVNYGPPLSLSNSTTMHFTIHAEILEFFGNFALNTHTQLNLQFFANLKIQKLESVLLKKLHTHNFSQLNLCNTDRFFILMQFQVSYHSILKLSKVKPLTNHKMLSKCMTKNN